MNEPVLLDLRTPWAVTPERYMYPGPSALFVHSMGCSIPRSIAVICYDNALRLLTLEDAQAKLITIAVDYLPSIVGGELSTVEASSRNEVLAYLQSRRLVLFDLHSKTHQSHRVIPDIDMEVIAVAGSYVSLDPPVIAVQVEDTSHYDEDNRVDGRLIALRLGDTTAQSKASLELGRDLGRAVDWGAGRGLIAATVAGSFGIYGPDLRYDPNHPLGHAVRALAEERKALKVCYPRFHPEREIMAFALIEKDRAGTRTYSLFQADFGGNTVSIEPIALAADVGLVRIESYAPGGEWLLFRVGSGGVTHFYVHHLSKREPPVHLGSFTSPRASHFACEPLSLIVMDDELEVVCLFPLPRPNGA